MDIAGTDGVEYAEENLQNYKCITHRMYLFWWRDVFAESGNAEGFCCKIRGIF